MALNFSEFLDSLTKPEYQTEGKKPTCPKGFSWDEKVGACVPSAKTAKKGEEPGDRALPSALASFDVFGSDGLNGADPAIAVEEQVEGSETIEEMSMSDYSDRKYQKKLADHEAAAKQQDDRMKYGRRGSEEAKERPLRKGEVKTFNKETGKWESNKK